jgi:signal transduction histidine kinase/CheY-like chemotaxis protein
MSPDEVPARIASESALGSADAAVPRTHADATAGMPAARSVEGVAGPGGDGPRVALGSWPGTAQAAAVARPLAGATTSGWSALDRARRGDPAAVRVLVVGAPDGGRLAIAARAEGMTVATTIADAAADSASRVRCHAIIVDAAAVAGAGAALVAGLAEAVPATPVIVAGVASGQGPAWIEAGADDFLEDDQVDVDAVRRAIEAAVARGQVRAAHRRLQYADRLAAIGRLATGVAHEVNNPAAYLLMNLRTCRDYVAELRPDLEAPSSDGAPRASLALLDEMADMLDDNIRGVERIVGVVQALRSYARGEPDELESVELGEVCRGATALVADQVQHLARLHLDIGDGLRVTGDPRRLHEVIGNLLANAIDAVIARHDSDHEIAIETVTRGAWAVVRISDTGAGIAPAVRERIFEPFFTTKPRGAGSGLGLSIARDVVEQAGGRIEVDSEPGRGTSFEVVLPLELAGGAEAAVSRPAEERARVRLLVIDDEVALTSALRRQLGAHHDVDVANSGPAALELLERRSFDVVLCDVMMPEMDGVAVREALARRDPGLAERLVFMTGGLSAERTRRAVEALALPVLGKPVPLEILLDAIDLARSR